VLLLAVDTSGKSGSIALTHVRAGRREVDVIESVPLEGGTFSAQLIPQISSLLATRGYSKSDLTGFAVVSGPGSFTGLRVGLAAVKALAEVLQKPIAAVSLLEAIAWSARVRGHVLAALDAGRGEVYAGEYEIAPGDPKPPPRMIGERLLEREEFVAEARMKSVVSSSASLSDLLLAVGIPCQRIEDPGPLVIARLGWERIELGQTVRPEDLEANYIRRSDAEIFSKPRT